MKREQKIDPTVTEKQQELYDIFVGQGINLAAQFADTLEPDPQLIGQAMFEIVSRVESEGNKNGVIFDLAVMLHGAQEILTTLLEMSGIELQEDQIKETVGYMVGMYLDNAIETGKMTKEEVIQLSEQAKQQGEGLLQGPGQLE
jgi:hypothetical protein